MWYKTILLKADGGTKMFSMFNMGYDFLIMGNYPPPWYPGLKWLLPNAVYSISIDDDIVEFSLTIFAWQRYFWVLQHVPIFGKPSMDGEPVPISGNEVCKKDSAQK